MRRLLTACLLVSCGGTQSTPAEPTTPRQATAVDVVRGSRYIVQIPRGYERLRRSETGTSIVMHARALGSEFVVTRVDFPEGRRFALNEARCRALARATLDSLSTTETPTDLSVLAGSSEACRFRSVVDGTAHYFSANLNAAYGFVTFVQSCSGSETLCTAFLDSFRWEYPFEYVVPSGYREELPPSTMRGHVVAHYVAESQGTISIVDFGESSAMPGEAAVSDSLCRQFAAQLPEHPDHIGLSTWGARPACEFRFDGEQTKHWSFTALTSYGVHVLHCDGSMSEGPTAGCEELRQTWVWR